MCESAGQGGAVCVGKCALSIRKMRFPELIGTKVVANTSVVMMPRNRILISTYVNFGKFQRYTAGVKVAGIEDEKGGDVEAISCRWSTSSDYRRMFARFLRTVGFYRKCAAGKYDYLNTGGNFSFFVLYSTEGGCKADAIDNDGEEAKFL